MFHRIQKLTCVWIEKSNFELGICLCIYMFINRRKSILRGPVVVWKLCDICVCIWSSHINLKHVWIYSENAQVKWVLCAVQTRCVHKKLFIVVVVNGSGVLKRHADVQSFFGTQGLVNKSMRQANLWLGLVFVGSSVGAAAPTVFMYTWYTFLHS